MIPQLSRLTRKDKDKGLGNNREKKDKNYWGNNNEII